ncbi:MAG: polyphosphate polymerase domain-containing protein [Specibacter sp.]
MSCRRVLSEGLALRKPIGLAAVLAEAALMRRVDKKFLLSKVELAIFLNRLGPGFKAMEIDSRRVFGYSSTYFDTPGLDQFRAHRQGRRRRFKARTRTYLDSGLCMFEAKLKGARGETDKHRIPHPLAQHASMNPESGDFLAALLAEHYGIQLPELVPVITTDYRRGTLVDAHSGERVTLDVQLVCSDADRTVPGPDLVVVETKSVDGRGAADRLLAAMGIRAVAMSKYCVGIALLHPELPANKWDRVLREHFNRHRSGPGFPAPDAAAGFRLSAA